IDHQLIDQHIRLHWDRRPSRRISWSFRNVDPANFSLVRICIALEGQRLCRLSAHVIDARERIESTLELMVAQVGDWNQEALSSQSVMQVARAFYGPIQTIETVSNANNRLLRDCPIRIGLTIKAPEGLRPRGPRPT